MKVYRAVPDAFLTNNKLDQTSIHGLEGIYYQAGYSSFVGEMGYHDFNNLASNIKDEGKYFFLFAEDALQEAKHLIGGYHRLRSDTCLVVEYDIPEELLLKMIGYGDYTEDIYTNYLIESYVTKNDFGDSIITTDELSLETKRAILVDTLKASISRIIEIDSLFELLDYSGYFKGKELKEVIEDKELLMETLINSSLYEAFMNQKRQLIKSPYITGKVLPVNMDFWRDELGDFDQIAEYYQNLGVECDFSKEHKESKDELLDSIINNKEKEKEKIRELLHVIKH